MFNVYELRTVGSNTYIHAAELDLVHDASYIASVIGTIIFEVILQLCVDDNEQSTQVQYHYKKR